MSKAPRKPWTDEDRKRLKQLFDSNVEKLEVAKLMGRSVLAIDARADIEGLSFMVRDRGKRNPRVKIANASLF
jgi:hypothetical protein